MALPPSEIRALRTRNPKPRARDFADLHGIPEAALVAAHQGHGVTRIDATVSRLLPLIGGLGDVMALTRNASCVHERRGSYADFQGGDHASMVLGEEIDLRIFPSHWVHGFAVDDGAGRSLQVFDAAGDAVHKVHLKPHSDAAGFADLVAALALDPREALPFTPRTAPEGAIADAARADALRHDWDRMTDTHHFLKLTRRLKMNRLGAYRTVGAPKARRLAPQAATQALHQAAAEAVPVMIFVGNAGCIQIHGGLIDKVVPMGPWINVMDPRFNLHLRADHIAECWLVNKPTQRGAAISVEAFDAAGGLILQIFGHRKAGGWDAWNALTLRLAVQETEGVA